jgi:hypothetical protein
MMDCGCPLIMAAGAFVRQHDGKVNDETLASFVKLFSVYGFFMEPSWEELEIPLGPADLMIIDPDAVVKQLETSPWQQAQQFIGGMQSPAAFFKSYDAEKHEMEVLKIKYAKHQAAIGAKFEELVRWEWMKENMPDDKHLKAPDDN